MKSVIIIRGVSGSGKSTFAHLLTEEDTICCADDFFVNPFGEYIFDPKKLKAAHEYCKGKFLGLCMANAEKIVVANTNTSEWEFEEYEATAKKFGYYVFHVVLENRHGNKDIHGVPTEVKEKQKERLKNSLKL